MKFTPRENDVAELMAKGWSNKKIASHLGITTSTVKLYAEKIYKKAELDTSNYHKRIPFLLWWRNKI
jgi:DNA-binding NarL/FixJ family response regulator